MTLSSLFFVNSTPPIRPAPFSLPHASPRSRSRTTPSRSYIVASAASNKRVTVLDYGAGNVRSLENAVRLFGYDIHWARTAQDITDAEKLIFPGVGSFGAAMENLQSRGFVDALSDYIRADRPFLGICLGLQTLFESSEESPHIAGLGIFPGRVSRFDVKRFSLNVPHIGWNLLDETRQSQLLLPDSIEQSDVDDRYYFVHSFRVGEDIISTLPSNAVLATTTHGETFLSVLQHGRICATQFHPEKSGPAGLRLIRNFLSATDIAETPNIPASARTARAKGGLAKRVVACLDVRENDAGDLVVTKGDQYDVRDASSSEVRNLGKPVDLASRYFSDGADEVTFLNITSFRGEPVNEAPMLEVLARTSQRVFVPLCIGGGIRDYVDSSGKKYSALDVAATYFRAGADKISLGSDAVYAAERFVETGVRDGTSSIETISRVYGAQAVVVSVDPKRVYVDEKEECKFDTVTLPDGRRCWYQCTVKGGREGRDIDVVQLVQASEALGAGEILLNSMDQDGQGEGYDVELIRLVRKAVNIPVIASSGAGKAEHFTECFDATDVEAALAAGIFHRREVSIEDVKTHMLEHGTPVRVSGSFDALVGAC